MPAKFVCLAYLNLIAEVAPQSIYSFLFFSFSGRFTTCPAPPEDVSITWALVANASIAAGPCGAVWRGEVGWYGPIAYFNLLQVMKFLTEPLASLMFLFCLLIWGLI